MLAFLLGVVLGTAEARQASPAPLSLYVFGLEGEEGFGDELLDLFRRELGRHVDSFTQVAYGREEADVAVQLLGQGELTVRLGTSGEPEGYLFRPDEEAPKMWALVHVGEHSRAFSVEGSGGRKLSELGKEVADWVRERSTTIRERRNG